MRTALVLLLAVLGAACGQDAPPPPPAPTPPTQPAPPAPPGVPGTTRVQAGGQNVWPPTGPGCPALVACCAAAARSDVTLFCQMSVATPPVSCLAALASVRSYLGERGLAVPPQCHVGGSGPVGGGAPIGPGTLAGPPWVELALPQVEGWDRAAPEDHGPERGFIVEYNVHGQISVTVYVYRGGVASIRRDPALLAVQVQGALAGMRQAQQMGRYDAVRELSPVTQTTLGGLPGAPPAAHQRVAITREGTERTSETYVTTHRGFFFKLRISLLVAQSPATDATLRALLARLAPAVQE